MLFNYKQKLKKIVYLFLCVIEILCALIKLLFLRITQGRFDIIYCMHSPTWGGTELQLQLYSEALQQNHCKNIIITTGHLDKSTPLNFTDIIKKKKLFHLHFFYLGIVNYQKHTVLNIAVSYLFVFLGATILHIFNPACCSLIPPSQRAGLRIIYSETGYPSENEWWNPLQNHLEKINFILSVSEVGLTQLRKKFNYYGPSKTIKSLIDPFPTHVAVNPLKKIDFHLIYYGRLCLSKGLDVLLKAFKMVIQIYPSACLTVVGDGVDKDSLIKMVSTLDLDKKIHFAGYLNRAELLEKLINADIYCLPSLAEGMPCSIIETMSIGLPVIATKVGGIPEILIENETGLLVEPNNHFAFFTAINKLFSNPDLIFSMRKKSIEHYQKFLSKEHSIQEILSVYRAVLTSTKDEN